ncbi:TlpA family protein disulfide reductase [Flavihumibacter sp. UBA7668]|uniref:TlpA family protein disulfide reductase n=1 Tax=Flavihumibacter sp. UBA7668 TaxID=1946542 RepID=UPI0025B85759|nr:TlpA disulfide reductase family protein [Flavihumibacter sp. UBA7668]
MIKIILFSIAFFSCIAARAQITISGTADKAAGQSIELTLYTADNYYDLYTQKTIVDKKNRFSFSVSVSKPVFARIKGNNWQQLLLLTNGRSLHIVQDTTGTIQFSGTAATENNLIQQTALAIQPFFMQPADSNPYVKLNYDQWQQQVWPVIEKELSRYNSSIAQSAIPAALKKLLTDEVRFIWQSYLFDFTNNNLSWAKNLSRNELLDQVMAWQPMPDSTQLISGFFANRMMSNRAHYELNKLARPIPGDTAGIESRASRYLNMPFEQISQLLKTYGERYILGWLYARNHLPASLQDKMLANKIEDAVAQGDFSAALFLYDTLRSAFPSSSYLPAITKLTQEVKSRLTALDGSNIHFIQPGSISNLKELAALYPGKVIYLDIWGTWCVPCKDEMKYVAELKQQFKGKDVVFFYLDMDAPHRKSTWEQYVKYHSITGEHYYMTNEEMASIWKEIEKAGGKSNLYPTYVLFNKRGEILHANARRPSEKELLYEQIETVLK